MLVLDRLATLSDPTRTRLLHVLQGRELAVAELCKILQLPQSTVSRHLRILADDGWIVFRSEGTSRFYIMKDELGPERAPLWQLVRGGLDGDVQTQQDAARLPAVLGERRARSRTFFSETAGEWDRQRDLLFGVRAELSALPALLDSTWTVGDLGTGTGHFAAAIAPFVSRVIAVDENETMLALAHQRLNGASNVEFRQGQLESLPIEDASLDAAILSFALTHQPEPRVVLAEARRALRPGGRVVVMDLTPHANEEYRTTLGHVWLGFGAETMTTLFHEAGFQQARYRALPAHADAAGPQLFAAVATCAHGANHSHDGDDHDRSNA